MIHAAKRKVVFKRKFKIFYPAFLFRNDYERVKILFRYGYRLEKKESMTDPLKKIELFKVDIVPIFKVKPIFLSLSYSKLSRFCISQTIFQALASPAYIVASLENLNEEGTDFFCPIKK